MKLPIYLYHPLYTLKEVGENIWIADGDVVEMKAGFTSVPFSTRMTLVRLVDGRLWCHSPIAPDEQLLSEIENLGQIAYLVAPNKIHYAHIPTWKERFPDATVYAAAGVKERAASQKIAFPDGLVFGDEMESPWEDELNQVIFKGSWFTEEVVFYHKKSCTLILTDLIENIRTEQMGQLPRLLYKLGDNAYPNGKTPRDFRVTFLRGKKAARKSLEQIRAWEVDNILLSHGDCHFGNGAEVLEKAFEWVKK